MASDEIAKAAERINEYLNGGGPSLAYPSNRDPHAAFRAEVSMFVRWWRDSIPAEADQPYSGDQWVEGVGLQIGVTADKRGRWWAEAHQDGARIVLTELKTMGEWRNLLDALGITPEKRK